jgi:hypothetical protein
MRCMRQMAIEAERGAALLLALLSLSLLSALAAMLLLSASSEVLIAGAFRDQRAGVYAADAILARTLDEVASMADWTPLVAGAQSATLVDGPPAGTRTLADGSTIDLRQVVNMAGCQKAAACTVSELDTVSSRRPWGATNPRWQLYAYGPLASLLPGGDNVPWYVVLMVADDPVRSDNTVVLRAEAFGPRNAHSVVEARTARPTAGGTDYNGGESAIPVHILAWREVR